MDNQNNPSDSFAGDFEFGSSDGSGNVADSSDSLSLSEIKSLTGRDYRDLATARVAIKETYSAIGKMGKVEKKVETLERQLETKEQELSKVDALAKELWYSKHPEYEPYRAVMSKMGKDPAEVAETEEFKKIFTDLSELEQTRKSRSVLESNPRIGQAKTRMQEAKDLTLKGQYTSANETAVGAVLEAYE